MTAEDGCLEEFENTAAYSREYQGAQDCMCDSEHMFDCDSHNSDISESELDQFVQQFQVCNDHFIAANFDGNRILFGCFEDGVARQGCKVNSAVKLVVQPTEKTTKRGENSA